LTPYVLQPGDIAVCSFPGPVDALIRAGQWANGDGDGDHAHAFIFIGDGLIAEARPGGACILHLQDTDYRNILWSHPRVTMTAAQRTKVVASARWYVLQHTGYSWVDYAALGAHRLHIPAPHLRAYIAGSTHMICSQLADQCALEAGVHLFDDGRWPGYVTPGDLARLFTEEDPHG
jgi:hypothetical protein